MVYMSRFFLRFFPSLETGKAAVTLTKSNLPVNSFRPIPLAVPRALEFVEQPVGAKEENT